jgi:prepilin-type N-terminal cleavage/methylation domain-containing protein
MPTHRPASRRSPRGFSIIELMVSVSIIALLIAIAFPTISALTGSSRVEAGLNVAGMSADVARQWVQAERWANDGSTTQPTLEEYSGTAALFSPTGEIRIVKNDRNARDAGGAYLEDDAAPQRNGYRDLDQVDYIQIPRGVGIAGIFKDPNNGGRVAFLAPPFAIAFNELGQLSFGDGNGLIYYNSDGVTPARYNTGQDRPNGYNPSEWVSDAERFAPDNFTLLLPFEAIECVPGVIVYDADEFEAAGLTFDGGGAAVRGSDEANWLEDNGRTIFFSPHTGVALRDEQE